MKNDWEMSIKPSTGEFIIICPGCGHENKLSELVWDLVQGRVEAKCTGETCEWKFRVEIEGRKKGIDPKKPWKKLMIGFISREKEE